MALNLQQATAVAYHPIIAERTLRFQTEDLLQSTQTRLGTMKIFLGSCGPAVALVVFTEPGDYRIAQSIAAAGGSAG